MRVTVRAGLRAVEIETSGMDARWRWRDEPAGWSAWTPWRPKVEAVRAACRWATEDIWPSGYHDGNVPS